MDYPSLRMPSFNFWESWSGIFKGLSYSDRGVLITWLIWYVFEGKLPRPFVEIDCRVDGNENLCAAFENIIPTIDKQMQRYQEYLNNKNQ